MASSVNPESAGTSLPHPSDLDASQVSRTFSKGLRVLETLAEAGRPMTVQELAKAVGSDRAIVYRMLRTLKLHGMLSESEGDGRFSLGLRLLTMARHLHFDVRRGIYPILEDLANTTGATAFLGVLDGNEVVCFASVEAQNARVTVRYREGVRHPAGVGASGRAIQLLGPPSTNDDPDLTAARRVGYTSSAETLEMGAAAVSAPIKSPIHGQLACVTVIFPISDKRDLEATGELVLSAAGRISVSLDL